MKKSLYFAATALLAASCASDEIVEETSNGYAPETKAPISFVTNQKNITRAQDLNKVGHYNFGVFAYKSTEAVNNIMDNYLVGFNGTDDAGNDVGYYMTTTNQTTLGDAGGYVDGKSMWQYEKLGNTEYEYAGEGYYKASQTEYMSNVDKQYLRYWDMSAPTTTFYAYSPYINGTGTASYDNASKVMTIPDGSLKDGYNDPALCEYMYATTTVNKADYGKDVRLEFKRLNAKVNIKFWEDIEGYSVRILDLNSSNEGVQAAPSIKEAGQGKYGYKKGEYFKKNGVTIDFSGATPAVAQTTPTATDQTPLVFAAPTVDKIGETRLEASKSETDYYAIPKDNTTGFTFHVTYELTSTTGERIVVRNATVHVPVAYTNWEMNTHYTYIFKITSNSNGTTEEEDPSDPSAPVIDPTDPEVPTESALYPIIFDNCTVEEWKENESEWNISDEVKAAYYDVVLGQYSIAPGATPFTVSVNSINDYANTTTPVVLTATNLKITPVDANVTFDPATSKITVAAGAAPGVYTVTYECDATDVDANHPRFWSETFSVGSTYVISTNLDEVGTHGLATTKLAITLTQDGTDISTASAASAEIEYPVNFTAAQKAGVKVNAAGQVEVATDATVGSYNLIYKVGGTKVAEYPFSVVDYHFALDNEVVYLNGAQTVKGNQVADATHVYTVAAGTGTSTLSINTTSKNQVDIPANTTEGTYIVTYTVQGGTVSEVKYQKTFEVRNIHTVSLSANAMDRDKNAPTPGDYSTDAKIITLTQNGAATTTDLSAKLSIVKADGTATSAGDFKITYVTADGSYKLEVKNTVAAANYRVMFVSTVAGADKAEYFDFVVTE